jgi:enoyl-CoA hydratase
MADSWFEGYPGMAFERPDHGVLVITLNRPERLNATSAADHKALSRVWHDIDDDEDLRVVVVTGAERRSQPAETSSGSNRWFRTTTE